VKYLRIFIYVYQSLGKKLFKIWMNDHYYNRSFRDCQCLIPIWVQINIVGVPVHARLCPVTPCPKNADLPPPMHGYCVKTWIIGQNLCADSGKSLFPGQGVTGRAE
jgi:hypothetical protein